MADPKVYTRGGDAGETSMLSGERVSKADPHIAAVGDLDELSVALGFARLGFPKRAEALKDIQQKLYQISAAVSYTGDKHADRFKLEDGAVEALEKTIDEISLIPGFTVNNSRSHGAYFSTSLIVLGLGPITLIFPIKTFQNCDSSSILYLLITCPTRVILGSF